MNIFIASIDNGEGTLTPEESWHCAKVLRKKAGDRLHLIDGIGNFYEGELTLVSDKKCVVRVTSGPRPQKKRSYYLHLAIAPTKQVDRIEWMIEKAVEAGIDEISFIQCKNSERVVLKHERMLKIVESAVKQSLQAFIPKVNQLVSLQELIANNTGDQKLIAHCGTGSRKHVRDIDFRNKSSVILIGPEGDFTHEEVALAENTGFTALDLGDNRLRTETAGLYVTIAASILS